MLKIWGGIFKIKLNLIASLLACELMLNEFRRFDIK